MAVVPELYRNCTGTVLNKSYTSDAKSTTSSFARRAPIPASMGWLANNNGINCTAVLKLYTDCLQMVTLYSSK